FGRRRYMKLSSPNMNNLMLVGGMMVYIAVILFGLDAVSVSNVKVWVLSLGFTLAFGSLFAKTWRVHQIMYNKKLTKKNLKDIHLFAIVFMLIVIDVVILTVWVVVDRYSLSIAHFPSQASSPWLFVVVTLSVDPHNDDLVHTPQRNICRCQHETYWMTTIYTYKGSLLLFGLFLAWATRKVTVAALNDSKYIGMSVYNVVLLCVVAAPIGFLVGDDKFESTYVITSVFVIFCTTITICLIFVPKVIHHVI
ncbi:Gamma-aminobutyric acid type B receptor subunit 2, partial [Lamellibrachia satsuma]